MSHNELDYVRKIREHGFRMTPQRQIVLDAVCAGEGHTTFEEICARVQESAEFINRSTVYRTLEFLESLHLVVSAEIGGKTVFEIVHSEPHHHLVCRCCGTEIEIGANEIAATTTSIQEQYGFQIEVDHLVFSGRCRECSG